MAEVKVQNLLRLYKLRDKFDAVILAVHACLVEREFRCINSGEEVSQQTGVVFKKLSRGKKYKLTQCKLQTSCHIFIC